MKQPRSAQTKIFRTNLQQKPPQPTSLQTQWAPAMAMANATRIARTLSSSSPSSLTTLICTSTADNPLILVVGHGVSKPRFASSSWPPSSSKPTKKSTDRLSAVIDAANDRKLPPELRGQRNAIRSETDIINVVEQRIWHSMLEGQFENLPGKGKPLNLDDNPHADPSEDTLYRILSKNGCAPEWVELNKQIRKNISEWRSALKKAWACKCDGDNSKWIECSEILKVKMRDINDMVFRYNLIVPFGRQMFGLKWEKELASLNE